jgi:hypothetical protein
MTTKIFCDKCGKDKGIIRNFRIKRENSLDLEYASILEADICQGCFKKLSLIIEEFFNSKDIKFRT